MSALLDRLRGDQTLALKAGDRLRLGTLRLLSSELTNRRIELGRELTDDEVIGVLTRARKQRLESEEQFTRGARPELAAREAAEAVIIQEYLPAPLDEAALDALIGEAIAETGATGVKQMGAVMAQLRPAIIGRADAAVVSRKVRDRLA
ncbi:MAG: GatB/YqeY domain-containing protein [Gemmatimonadota bacterium]